MLGDISSQEEYWIQCPMQLCLLNGDIRPTITTTAPIKCVERIELMQKVSNK